MTTSHDIDDRGDAPPEPTLYKAVSSAAWRLGNGLLSDNQQTVSSSRSTLAKLRRATGGRPGEDPMSWGVVAEEALVNLPEGDIGRGANLSYAEWAAYVALGMFALHQQSRSDIMHQAGVNLGQAVGILHRESGSESIKMRLDALMLARTPDAIQYHLRTLVSLLNSHGIPMDYGRLAEDLKRLRFAHSKSSVIVSWGRGYAQALNPRSSAQ